MGTAIILAGGLGTRLRKIVSNVPKPMAPVNGVPFLVYLFNFLKKNKIDKVILAVGYLSDHIENYFHNEYKNIIIEYSREEKPIGTGGAILKATNYLKNEKFVYIINGDTYFPINLKKLKIFFKSKKANLALGLKRKNFAKRFGKFKLKKDGKINKIINKNNSNKNYINGGIYIANVKYLKLLKKKIKKNFISFEKDIIEKKINLRSHHYGKAFKNKFIDIGIPTDYKKIHNIMRKKVI